MGADGNPEQASAASQAGQDLAKWHPYIRHRCYSSLDPVFHFSRLILSNALYNVRQLRSDSHRSRGAGLGSTKSLTTCPKKPLPCNACAPKDERSAD